MKSTKKKPNAARPVSDGMPQSGRAGGDVSIVTTLVRTVILVMLTLAIAASVRFFPPATHLVQRAAGTEAWVSLYGALGIGGAMEREQMILVGIFVASFILALLLQTVSLFVWNRFIARHRRAG